MENYPVAMERVGVRDLFVKWVIWVSSREIRTYRKGNY